VAHAENFDKTVAERGSSTDGGTLRTEVERTGSSERNVAFAAMQGGSTASLYLPNAADMLKALSGASSEGKGAGRGSGDVPPRDGAQSAIWHDWMKKPEAQTMPWYDWMKKPEAQTMPWRVGQKEPQPVDGHIARVEKPSLTENPGNPLAPFDLKCPSGVVKLGPEIPLNPNDPKGHGRPSDTETPGDPKIPLEPGKPSKPENPLNPCNPLEPNNPFDPKNPLEPNNPLDPKNPFEPNNPLDPKNPLEPNNPLDPENPLEPDDPFAPENPSEPNEPMNPVGPEDPGDVDGPEGPSCPGAPDLVSPGEILEQNKRGRKTRSLLPRHFGRNSGGKPVPIVETQPEITLL
jgi:hypothetical protein